MQIPPRSRGRAEAKAPRSFVARNVVLPVQAYIHTAGLSGMALVAAAAVAILWANSPWSASYFALQHTKLTLDLGFLRIEESLQHWVNDALMTFFFFVVGLEIKRELVAGELSDVRRAMLPLIAALGGMVVPAAIYYALNHGTAGVRGWGIPMATDIAFALGVLALLGDRIPSQIRVLLLALAIVDDIGAIVVIAIFYSQGISWAALGLAFALLGLVVMMRYSGVVGFGPYYLVGAMIWLAVFASGVHATLTGVALGLLAPSRPWFALSRYSEAAQDLLQRFDRAMEEGDRQRAEVLLGHMEELNHGTESPLDRLVRTLHPWTSYLVLPVFALINAGVRLDASSLRAALESRVALGVFLGLVVGKLVGIFGFSWASVRLGLTTLPRGATMAHVVGVALLGGIGFTVSLFITDLAFTDSALIDAGKIGILAASLLAGALGYSYLRLTTSLEPKREAGVLGAEPQPAASPD